jgi:hypothetical protein
MTSKPFGKTRFTKGTSIPSCFVAVVFCVAAFVFVAPAVTTGLAAEDDERLAEGFVFCAKAGVTATDKAKSVDKKIFFIKSKVYCLALDDKIF